MSYELTKTEDRKLMNFLKSNFPSDIKSTESSSIKSIYKALVAINSHGRNNKIPLSTLHPRVCSEFLQIL